MYGLFTQDPNVEAPVFEVPGTPYTLRIVDSMDSREVRAHPDLVTFNL